MQTVAEAVASDTGSEEREVKATALGSTISNGQTESKRGSQRRCEGESRKGENGGGGIERERFTEI